MNLKHHVPLANAGISMSMAFSTLCTDGLTMLMVVRVRGKESRASLASLAALVFARRTCRVPAIGGGEDDGPAINAAFKECSKHSKIVLDKYYVVDTLLLTKDLDDVKIELSGTG